MPAFVNQSRDVWQRLKPTQRVMIALAAVLTLGVVAALAFYGSRAEYGVLFSDLKPADAQGIVERLKSENVPYQLTAGGTSVSVPQERVAELRLQLAAAGVISGGHVGFDIFDRGQFGATDFAQQVNYQRALEGELARTLESLDEIESARVHITRPKESLYSEKEQKAKGSVMLRVRQGHDLSRERTGAIVSLVASAVEGLDPADISVSDTRGRLLNAPSDANRQGFGGEAFDSHLEARRRFEAETAARVVALLEPVTGSDHARADVSADLDFSQIEQTEERYDPKSAVIRSQQTAQESRTSQTGGQGGVAGARANDPSLPPAAASVAPAAANGDQRQATTTNYEIDKTVRRTIGGGGGRLTRLSVSVVIDYKQAEGNQVARSPEELSKIKDIVAAAVGLDAGRGDQIVVQTMPFNRLPEDDAKLSWLDRYRDLVQTAIKYSLLVFAVLLLLLFVVRPAKRALRLASAPEPQLLAAGAGGAGVIALGAGEAPDEAEANQTHALAAGETPQLAAAMTTEPRTIAEIEAEVEAQVASEFAAIVPEVRRATAIKKQLIERSRVEPEVLAMTLRGWLQDAKN